MSSLSFFPLIPAVTTASAAPVYHGGMIPCLGDVEPVNTRWLIKGYFPMGAVSVVAGPGGVGKGVFMADVVAAVTTGRPTMLFPDAAVAQGNVLVLTSEDDPGMSLAPRMIAAEADMRRVFYATPGWYWQQKKKKLVIGASLFELIDELHPALVIIDPLRSFLEGNAVANGDVMRRALDMLQEKALADQFSVVIVSHMVKKAGDDARMLLAGSGELWNAARSVTILGRLPMDESVTYVTPEKLNVGTKARSILFHTQTVGVKNKAGEEDTGRGELKLPVLSVVEICRADLDKKQNGQDHIADGKNHIVDHGLNLSFGGIPCVLDRSRHIARRKCGHGEGRYKDGHKQKRKHNSHRFLFHRIHKRLPPITF